RRAAAGDHRSDEDGVHGARSPRRARGPGPLPGRRAGRGGGRADRVGKMTDPIGITIYEVGPRDGLQNEKQSVPTEAKIRYIDLLSETGLRYIEATSFVSPRAIPQLADAAEVMRGISRAAGVRYPVLVPNAKGMERALE